MTPAEKMRAYRARKRARGLRLRQYWSPSAPAESSLAEESAVMPTSTRSKKPEPSTRSTINRPRLERSPVDPRFYVVRGVSWPPGATFRRDDLYD